MFHPWLFFLERSITSVWSLASTELCPYFSCFLFITIAKSATAHGIDYIQAHTCGIIRNWLLASAVCCHRAVHQSWPIEFDPTFPCDTLSTCFTTESTIEGTSSKSRSQPIGGSSCWWTLLTTTPLWFWGPRATGKRGLKCLQGMVHRWVHGFQSPGTPHLLPYSTQGNIFWDQRRSWSKTFKNNINGYKWTMGSNGCFVASKRSVSRLPSHPRKGLKWSLKLGRLRRSCVADIWWRKKLIASEHMQFFSHVFSCCF